MNTKTDKIKRVIISAILISLFFNGLSFREDIRAYAAKTTRPAKVTGLKCIVIKKTSVRVKWRGVKDADGYEIKRNHRTVKRTKKTSYSDILKYGKKY